MPDISQIKIEETTYDIKDNVARQGSGTTNYNSLTNKPKINDIELTGNKTLEDLGVQAALTFDNTPTENSNNIVKSGGVWSGLNTVNQNFGTVELSSVAAYPHSVGETFINAAGQMVKCTAAIAVNDTITIDSNVAVTNIASALIELNSNIEMANRHWYWVEYLSTNPFTFNPSQRNFIALVVDGQGNMAASMFATYNGSRYTNYDIKTSASITITMLDNTICSISHTYAAGLYVLYFRR